MCCPGVLGTPWVKGVRRQESRDWSADPVKNFPLEWEFLYLCCVAASVDREGVYVGSRRFAYGGRLVSGCAFLGENLLRGVI